MIRYCSAALVAASLLSGCTGVNPLVAPSHDMALAEGPPIRDIVTPFDQALACLKSKINPSIAFAVGAILDNTGKEQLTDGGTGRFITQGAGDIVQSSLFKAGATVVNRRDPRVMTTEVQWRIRDPRRIVPTNYYITGSINSLDFIPGGGFDVQVAGVGPRYRQYRILIGLDLAMTDANTGRIVANVPLQKQIYASESGVGIGRFFGNTLVSLDIGANEREALQFALRQMLYLATFDLLTQVMTPANYAHCRGLVDDAYGKVENTGTAEAAAKYQAASTAEPASKPVAAAAATAPAVAQGGTAADPESFADGLTPDPDAGEAQAASEESGAYWASERPSDAAAVGVSTVLQN